MKTLFTTLITASLFTFGYGQTSLLRDDANDNIYTVPEFRKMALGRTLPQKLLHLYSYGTAEEANATTVRLEYCASDAQQQGGGGDTEPEECNNNTLWDIYNNGALYFEADEEVKAFALSKDGNAFIETGFLKIGSAFGFSPGGLNKLLITEGRIMVGQEGVSGQLYSHLERNDLKFHRNNYSSYIAQMGTGNLSFVTNGDYNNIRMIINQAGNIGIGNTSPDYELDVCGTIRAGQVRVENTTGWCDYVFDPEYKLVKLSDVEAYVQKHKHLPEIPSEEEVLANGVDLGEMNKALLKKVEELTLYLIEMEKRIRELEDAR